MANELFNKKGESVRPRPTFSGCIIGEGVSAALENGHLYIDVDDSDVDSFSYDVIDCYYEGIDAYEFAKLMEAKGHSVDKEFVDDMEQIDSYIQDAHRKAVKHWFESCEPQPPFAIGTELDISGFSGSQCAVIEGIYEYAPAYYTVKPIDQDEGDTSRRLIRFEDAVLAPIESTET